jgi:hypothetical protein
MKQARNTAFGDRLALLGLRDSLVARGVPSVFALEIAGACYPAGAERERRKSGRIFVFAQSRVSPTDARAIVARLLEAPAHELHSEVLHALVFIFGSERVQEWLEGDSPASSGQNAEQEQELTDALELLGLPADVTKEQLDSRFRELIQQNHPDRYHGATQEIRQQREEQTRRINLAVEVVRRRLREAKPVGEQDQEGGGGGIAVPPAGKPRPRDEGRQEDSGPPPKKDPKGQRVLWLVLLGVGLLAVIGFIAYPYMPIQEPRPPLLPPRPVASALERVSELAKQATEAKEFRHAILQLTPLSEKYPRKDDIDLKLWAGCLEVLQSQGKEYWYRSLDHSDDDERVHWRARHDIGLAWHRLMKDAIAQKQTHLAQQAFGNANRQYREVIVAVLLVPTPPSNSDWRRRLVAHTQENCGELCGQKAAYSRDRKLNAQSRRELEQCRKNYAEIYGVDSDQYRRIEKKLEEVVRQSKVD